MTDPAKALAELKALWAEATQTTKGYRQMAQPLAPTSKWYAAQQHYLAAVAALTPPPATSTPRFGISTGSAIIHRSAVDRDYELGQCASVGATLVRLDYWSSECAPTIDKAISLGLEPVIVVGGTVAAPGPGALAYAALAKEAAARYPSVRYFELGNEPDLNGWTPASYVPYLKAGHDAVKAANPAATVLNGGLFTGGGGMQAWVQGIYDNGGGPYMDMVALHLYEDATVRGAWNGWDQAFHLSPCVRSVMDAHGDTGKLISSTESGGDASQIGEAAQAKYVGDAYDDFAARDRVGFVCSYAMMDDDTPGYGLLRLDRSHRPAWQTFQQRATA